MADYLNGWVKLHRQIINWEWFKKPETLSVFIYCLTRANIADGSWRNIAYKRGQFITSLETIHKDTGLSIQQTRTALKHLISTGEITSESTSQYRIITVCKFSDYQQTPDESNKQYNSQSTNNQQTDSSEPNKQLTIGREEGEVEEKRRGRKERKISFNKDKKKSSFIPPTLQEVADYLSQKGITSFTAQSFIAYYEKDNWKAGRKAITDWRKKVDEWTERNRSNTSKTNSGFSPTGIASSGYGITLPDGTHFY